MSDRHRGHRIELWVTEAQHAKLRELAAGDELTSTGRSLSSIFREAIDDWLAAHEEPRVLEPTKGKRQYVRRNLTPREERRLIDALGRERFERLTRTPGGPS